MLTMGPDHRRWILDAWPQHGRKVLLLGQAARVMSDLPADLERDREDWKAQAQELARRDVPQGQIASPPRRWWSWRRG